MTNRAEIRKQCRHNAAYWLKCLRWAVTMNRQYNDVFYSRMVSRHARYYAYWKAKAAIEDTVLSRNSA